MTTLVQKIIEYFCPGIVSLATVQNLAPATGLEFNGAVLNDSQVIQLVSTFLQNAAAVGGLWNYVTDATGTGTWNVAVAPTGIASLVILQSGQAAISKTTDTALNVVANGFPGPYIGQTALFVVANTNSGTLTVVAGTNVTLAGTTTVLTVSTRLYQVKITNLANPFLPGVTSTNTTTTTAAVAITIPSTTTTSVVIPVTSATGIIVGSVLQVAQTNGTLFTGTVTAVNTLNITVSNTNNVAIASGAAVSVFNTLVTLTGMFTVAANVAA